jgi:hypothetical protein
MQHCNENTKIRTTCKLMESIILTSILKVLEKSSRISLIKRSNDLLEIFVKKHGA